jgi:hypothetical protein
LIPGSILFKLPIDDQDVDVLPFSAWADHEASMATRITDFIRAVEVNG